MGNYKDKSKEDLIIEIEFLKKQINNYEKENLLSKNNKVKESKIALEKLNLYKNIFQESNDAIAILDKKGFYIEQNKAHEKLIGYSDKEIQGKTPEIHLGKDAFKDIVKKLSKNKIYNSELISHTKQGHRNIALSSFAIIDKENKIKFFIGIKRDITKQKIEELKLKKQFKNIDFLRKTAVKFTRNVYEKNIFNYIGNALRELCPDAYVLISEINQQFIIPKSILGPKNILLEIISLLNYHPIDKHFEYTENLIDLSAGNILKFEGNLQDLFLNNIPKPIAYSIEKILNVKNIYGVAFTIDKQIYANAAIVFPKGKNISNTETIEAFVKQASLALKRVKTETELINEKKISEESKIKYQTLVESSHDGIYICKGNKFIFVNKVICKILGYTEEELTEMNIWNIIHPNEVKRIKQYSIDKFKEKSTLNLFTSKILTKKNEIKIAEFHIKPINLFDEQVLFGVVRDITEREKADLKIKESEKKYRSLINGINDAIFVHPLKKEGFGNFIEVNDIACKRLGYSKEELLNMTAKQISIKSSAAKQSSKKGRSELLTKQWHVFESVHITKSGRKIPVEISSTVFIYERKLSILSLVKDITKRKETEAELFKYRNNLEKIVKERTKELELKEMRIEESQKAMRFLLEDVNEARNELSKINKKLSDSNKDLESFAYSVSHDLKSPLRAINGYTNVLLEDFPEIFTGEKKEFMDLIIQNSSKMNILIDDLLRFSRVGRNKLDKFEFDLSVMVNDIIEQQSQAYSNHTIIKTVQNNLIVNADIAAIKQVLINLIGNALKFSSKKEQISIEFGKTKNRNKECFFIKDKGTGFDLKYLDKVFQVFQRLHNSDKFEGTGVGLALVKRIINKHGGDIWAESEIGKGSTFYFTVP